MPISDKEFMRNYDKYKNKIYTYFLYRVNFNQTIAEDLTSDVFLKAYKNIDRFLPGSSFQAWVYKIAKNHLLNYYRTCNREIDLEAASNIGECFKDKLDAQMELEKVMIEIDKLDDYYREVLLLRYVNHLSNEEIAEVLEKDEGAVRTQISRAMKILREKLNL